MAEGGNEGRSSTILLVEDEPNVANAIARFVRAEGLTPVIAKTLAVARNCLREALRGLILDISLPDGNGLSLIPEARANDPDMPIIVVTGVDASGVANKIHLLNAVYVCKPNVHANIRSFLRTCAASGQPNLSQLIDELETTYALTPAERRLIAAALMTSARERIAAHLGLSLNTVKRQIASILAKASANSLDELVAPLRAKALRCDLNPREDSERAR